MIGEWQSIILKVDLPSSKMNLGIEKKWRPTSRVQ